MTRRSQYVSNSSPSFIVYSNPPSTLFLGLYFFLEQVTCCEFKFLSMIQKNFSYLALVYDCTQKY